MGIWAMTYNKCGNILEINYRQNDHFIMTKSCTYFLSIIVVSYQANQGKVNKVDSKKNKRKLYLNINRFLKIGRLVERTQPLLSGRLQLNY